MISVKYVKRYCCEDISLIENYYKAINSSDKYDCHHKLEIQNDKTYSIKELIDMNLYYNRPASELIFLTNKEHASIHSVNKKLSEETKQKISLAHKGKYHSEKTKQKISLNRKGKCIGNTHNLGKHLSEETKQKLREAHKGKYHSEETKQKMRKPKPEYWKQKLRKPKPKFKWITPNNEIKIMDIANVKQHHPDWKLIEESL